MARLCGQNTYKPESTRRFATLFEQALKDDTDLVREAAVDGLICIDRPRALKILAKDYVNDRSQMVRNRILELAGDVGGKDDLGWLWEKVGTNAESKSAWQSMLKIFNNSDANVIESWFDRIERPAAGKLTDEQRIAFYEMAERKAVSESRSLIANSAREKLARLYSKAGQFEQAAEYLGKLRESAQTQKQKDVFLGQLLDVYLRWPRIDAAAWLLGNCLLERDLAADNILIRTVDTFWDNPSGGADPNAILEALRKIKPEQQRPLWEQNLARWGKRFGSSSQPAGSKPKNS
jgi:tetratricopeptide (TPR) repeat protein